MAVKNASFLFFILSVLYFFDVFRIKNTAPELLLIFHCVYLRSSPKYIVSLLFGLVSALFMCVFGNRGILFTMAFVSLFSWVVLKVLKKMPHIVAAIVFSLYESFYYMVYYINYVEPIFAFRNVVFPLVIYNLILYFLLCFMVEKSICHKKHLFLKEVI